MIHPPKIAKAELSESTKALVDKAKALYREKLAYFVYHHKPPAFIVKAPGRVNLIGEHTDYTGGFVLPLAIEYSTVIYGTGVLHTGKGKGSTTIRIRIVSDKADEVVEERSVSQVSCRPPDESDPRTWTNYVIGTVVQYLPDLPEEGCNLDIAMAYASDVPLGAGLSSSASLEVATATFMECFMNDLAYSSCSTKEEKVKERALRCQKAENDWAHSPCGIMDQMISSSAEEGHVMLLDCRNLGIVQVPLKKDESTATEPVLLITDSKVSHEISADSEYGLRRRQCNDALEAMQQVPLYHVLSLRDATFADAKSALDKGKMDELTFRRAKHVVTENQRTLECKTALKLGVWDRVGELMNASHTSLRDDFEVSCPEVDYLVDVAQKHDGVYGSRMTGGGFGGCTVSLVKKERAAEIMEHIKSAYKEKYDKEPQCFLTRPEKGAQVLAIDMDCKPESEP